MTWTATPTRSRLPPDMRRQQLLDVASRLLTERGVDAVEVKEVAAVAGVSRPVVYKFFPSRQALIMGLLDDFEQALTERFVAAAMRNIPGTLADITKVFIEAACDTIDAKGAGPWHLLGANGPDPEIAAVGRSILERFMAPWRQRITEATGQTEREVVTVSRVIVAAGRAVLDRWVEGDLSREEAIRDATRAISALLREFRVPNPLGSLD